MVASRQLISAVALGLALTMIGVGCAEDDGMLIGGRTGTRPGGTSGTGGDTGGTQNPDGSNLGGGIGGQESPPPVIASPTPTPTPTPTPPPSESLAFTVPIEYGNPRGLAFDWSGNAWVALNGAGGVVKIDPTSQILSDPQTGDGPSAVVADKSGNIWVANRAGNTLTKFNPSGAKSQLAVGAGPRDLAADNDGNLWVALEGARSLVKVTSSGATQSVATLAAGGVAVQGGKIWVTDTENDRVAVYDGQGNPDRTIPVGSNPGVIRASSDAVWVLSHSGNSVWRIDPATDETLNRGLSGAPADMAIDASGNAWVSVPAAGKVEKFAASGAFIKNYSIGIRPHGLAFAPAPSGRLWVTDETGHRVHVFVP
jgi:DNA-binding beta-propeller fold protein YncE